MVCKYVDMYEWYICCINRPITENKKVSESKSYEEQKGYCSTCFLVQKLVKNKEKTSQQPEWCHGSNFGISTSCASLSFSLPRLACFIRPIFNDTALIFNEREYLEKPEWCQGSIFVIPTFSTRSLSFFLSLFSISTVRFRFFPVLVPYGSMHATTKISRTCLTGFQFSVLLCSFESHDKSSLQLMLLS
jgi:hypothetical protein